MSDPRTDMEERLADALAQGAHAAPSAIGLAAAARTRARQRRRTHLAGAAVVAALAVGVPTAVLATGGSDGGDRGPGPAGDPSVATDPQPPGDANASGYHWESWHGVTVQVPNTWDYGDPATWCAAGGEPTTPLIGRPGVSNPILCTPSSSYGVTFTESHGNDVDWPVAGQNSESWPLGTYVGATTVDDVVVTVAARKSTVAQYVLDSVKSIEDFDPNGCAPDGFMSSRNPDQGAVSVCRYDGKGRLEQSELLSGRDAEQALAAVDAASERVDCGSTPRKGPAAIRVTSASHAVFIYLSSCAALTHGDQPTRTFALTSDVLYWALSPGWTGAVGGDVPLPPELRQR